MRCEGSSCDEQWEHARGPLQLDSEVVAAAPAGGGGRPPATRHRAKCPKKIVKLVRYKCGEVLLKMCNGPWQPVRTKSYAQDSVGTAPSMHIMPVPVAEGIDASSADVFWRRAVPGAGAASALVMPRGRGLYFKSTRVLGSTRELVPESWATQAVGPCSFKTQLQAA